MRWYGTYRKCRGRGTCCPTRGRSSPPISRCDDACRINGTPALNRPRISDQMFRIKLAAWRREGEEGCTEPTWQRPCTWTPHARSRCSAGAATRCTPPWAGPPSPSAPRRSRTAAAERFQFGRTVSVSVWSESNNPAAAVFAEN